MVRTILLIIASLALSSSQLRVDGTRFLDPQGRTVLLRGINVAGNSKVPPFRPLEGDLRKLDPLPGWGINVIRLLFIWEAYEPEPGKFNEEYLAEITRLADAAWEKGMYVVLDMHQDAFSRFYSTGCGAGFPSWAVPADLRKPAPKVPNGECGTFWVLGLAPKPSMHRSYREFYSDQNGVRTAFIRLWRKLAAHFKSHPGVVGYDLLNEPWGKENDEIRALYEDTAAAIAQEDDSALIFVEPHVVTVFGMIRTKIKKPKIKNLVYAPHFYDLRAQALHSWNPRSPYDTDLGFERMAGKAKDWNVPLFVGEFGAPADAKNVKKFVDYQYARLNEYLASSAQWNYTPEWNSKSKDGWNQEDMSIIDDHGRLRANFTPRAYPQKVAGKLTRVEMSRSGMLEVEWMHDAALGETQVYVPADSTGFIFNGSATDCAHEGHLVRCRSPKNGPIKLHITF